MGNKNLYIVGTVHIDCDGKDRLDALLERISPSVIALEFYKEQENFETLRTLEDDMKDIEESGLYPNPKQRATLVEYARKSREGRFFEYKSSVGYTKKNPGSRLEYIDISMFGDFKMEYNSLSKEIINGCVGDLELANSILKILDGGIDNYLQVLRGKVQRIYQDAEGMNKTVEELREMFRDPELSREAEAFMPPHQFKFLKQAVDPVRDEFMGNRIRELYNGNDALVAIVGLAHLQGLRIEVGDLNPRILTLAEYNSI